jgi:hypothetical protein
VVVARVAVDVVPTRAAVDVVSTRATSNAVAARATEDAVDAAGVLAPAVGRPPSQALRSSEMGNLTSGAGLS